MSRFYDICVEIEGLKPEKKDRIIAACAEEWSFDIEDFIENPPFSAETPKRLTAAALGNLCGGEMEDEFTDRLARAVWNANGDFCRVTIHATCLEYLPSETHIRDKDDYVKWKKAGEDKTVRRKRVTDTKTELKRGGGAK